VTDSTHHCNRCGKDKPTADFYSHPHAADKVRKPCKACLSDLRKDRYQRLGGIDVSYDQVLRREYGITLDDYSRKHREQAGRCAICRKPETVVVARTGKPLRLSVDHDHATNAVRGLLCRRCNTLVWALEDNHTALDAVRQYIEQWRDTFANGAPL
jgi:hypothetical protein